MRRFMQNQHTTFCLAGAEVHQLEFDAATFLEHDLLWLPHHAQLSHAAIKRKAEHLAGRIAAAHALKALTGRVDIPGIGPQREPLWPREVRGSISHSASLAVAVVVNNDRALVGIDIENIMEESIASECWQTVINDAERQRLHSLPFATAVTLAFSAKESLYKALYYRVNQLLDFTCAEVVALTPLTMTLALTEPLAGFPKGTAFTLHWQIEAERVLTLLCAA